MGRAPYQYVSFVVQQSECASVWRESAAASNTGMQAAIASPHASSSQKRVNVAPDHGHFLLEFVGSLYVSSSILSSITAWLRELDSTTPIGVTVTPMSVTAIDSTGPPGRT